MEAPWTRDEASASGQVFEDRVWALLTEQSRGHLHVFRPLLDRGVDALLHRLSDGAYIPVQAKGRTSLVRGEVYLDVRADSLTDDLVVMIAGELVEGGLGPTMLVVPTPNFRRLALLTSANGEPRYAMGFGMKPKSNSRWLPWQVTSNRLAEKFGVELELAAPVITYERPRLGGSPLGFLGESEVVRRLAEAEDLNLFRPFPDSELVELAVRHRKNGHVVGLQIKTVSIDGAHSLPTVDVPISTFRPFPTTYFTVLAWMPEQRRFHDECLVFPSEELIDFARPEGRNYEFRFHPGSATQPRLDKYRRPLVDLSTEIENLL